MLNVLLADDHAVVRKGLKGILEQAADPMTFGEATNGEEVLEKVRKEKWDFLVLDIAMPGLNGLDILKQLKLEQPSLPVLVLSMYPEQQFALRVMKAGASGYLTKESAPEELVKAIQKIRRGGKYISAYLADRLAQKLSNGENKLPHELLSDREYQVLCMISQGKTVKQIATELVLSVKTVSTYRSRILDKMNMKTNADLVSYCLRNKLIY